MSEPTRDQCGGQEQRCLTSFRGDLPNVPLSKPQHHIDGARRQTARLRTFRSRPRRRTRHGASRPEPGLQRGYSGDVNLAREANPLTRQLPAMIDHEEVAGLLPIVLLHHAPRTRPHGRLVPLAAQARSVWDTRLIAESVDILRAALAGDRLGEFWAQGRHLRAPRRRPDGRGGRPGQIVEWYDELIRITDSPVAPLNRAVAVGEAQGPNTAWRPSRSSTPLCPATAPSRRT
jgi:hypothetical protein